MGALKRYFPIPYLMVAMGAMGHIVVHLVRAPETGLAWVGALVAIVPLVSFMSSLVLVRRARTWRNQYLMLALALIGTVISFIGFESPASWYALFLGLIPSFGYIFWYSRLDRSASTAIAVGVTLPELELFDGDGKPVTPTEGKHGLYMFIRGNWCPLCMAQVKEIAAQYRALEARGVEVFLISRQPEANTRALAKRFDAPIRFCVDEDGQLARRLGIEHIGGVPFLMDTLGYDSDSVLPTVVITDPSRRIIFVDLTDNYRVRPEPSTFLAALDALA
ncbi:MAG: redoxin domain-containing protein [Deltaproteobacteria bacterium]|nr:redoxin domain-containing protein [Deltaproteobacteria bacterium]MBW2210153.1 redoxin domain-containing protein [Deltaproteobacteria bacterium]MBW2213680.1 redoxin domain-containing protein [Deltaproteobacteria bacterium]MBW2627098.1 redoxin domain-containing protein [Deltaproteobacteria bacterium]